MFAVNPSSKVPIYLQLKEAIRHQVASGALAPGERMPTVRQLAVDLAVNPNTVARVYAELTAEGYLEARQGSGTFVRAVGPELKAGRRRTITDTLRHALREALGLGYQPDELLRMVAEEIDALSGIDSERSGE